MLGKFVVGNLEAGRASCSANSCRASGETFARHVGGGPSHPPLRSGRENTAFWSGVKHSLGLTGPNYFKTTENTLLLGVFLGTLFKIIIVWVNKINDFSGTKTSYM